MDKIVHLLREAQKAFDVASESERQEALVKASQFITDCFEKDFRGERARKTQGLAWPRKSAFYDDGALISAVPESVKKATRLIAGYYLGEIRITADTLAPVVFVLDPVLRKEIKN